MYKEVAIDPECLADFSYYALIRMEFGFEKGRYISAAVKEWAREAYPFVKGSALPTIKKKSVTNFLNKLMKSNIQDVFLLADYRRNVSKDAWLEWWGAQSKIQTYPVTLSERGISDSINYMSILEGDESWKIKPTKLLGRNPEEIVDIIEPLLKISNKLLIVDLYFSFSANKTLCEVLRRLSTNGSSISNIHLVTSVRTKNPAVVFDQEYKSIMPAGMKFTLTQIPERYIHDRYFITDTGALKAGYGFKEGVEQGTPADKLSMNISSLEEVQIIYQGLDSAYRNGKASDVFKLP